MIDIKIVKRLEKGKNSYIWEEHVYTSTQCDIYRMNGGKDVGQSSYTDIKEPLI